VKSEKKISTAYPALRRYFIISAVCLSILWLLFIAAGAIGVAVKQQSEAGSCPASLADMYAAVSGLSNAVCRWGTPIVMMLAWCICRAVSANASDEEKKVLNIWGIITAAGGGVMLILELLLRVILGADIILLYTLCYGLPVSVMLLGFGLGLRESGERLESEQMEKAGLIYFWAAVICTVIEIILAILTTRVTVDGVSVMKVSSYVAIDWLICVPVCIAAMIDGARATAKKDQ